MQLMTGAHFLAGVFREASTECWFTVEKNPKNIYILLTNSKKVPILDGPSQKKLGKNSYFI